MGTLQDVCDSLVASARDVMAREQARSSAGLGNEGVDGEAGEGGGEAGLAADDGDALLRCDEDDDELPDLPGPRWARRGEGADALDPRAERAEGALLGALRDILRRASDAAKAAEGGGQPTGGLGPAAGLFRPEG